jgi:hypothetical protein
VANNLVKYSEDFSNWGVAGSIVLVSTSNVAPDGNDTAYSWYTVSTLGGYYGVNYTGKADQKYTIQGYIKNTGESYDFRIGSDVAVWGSGSATYQGHLSFNPYTKTFSNIQLGVSDYSYEDIGNDWFLVKLNLIHNSTDTNFSLIAYSFTTDVNVSAWGVQLYYGTEDFIYYKTDGTALDNVIVHADLSNAGYDLNGVAITYKSKQGILNDSDNYGPLTKFRYADNALLKTADTDNVRYDSSGNQ